MLEDFDNYADSFQILEFYRSIHFCRIADSTFMVICTFIQSANEVIYVQLVKIYILALTVVQNHEAPRGTVE
jgi:hypothetical protein